MNRVTPDHVSQSWIAISRRSSRLIEPYAARRRLITHSTLAPFIHSSQGAVTMTRRRWTHVGLISFAIALATTPASAQLATGGGQDGGMLAATGFAGLTNSGGYSASVPLDLPAARG